MYSHIEHEGTKKLIYEYVSFNKTLGMVEKLPANEAGGRFVVDCTSSHLFVAFVPIRLSKDPFSDLPLTLIDHSVGHVDARTFSLQTSEILVMRFFLL